MFSRQSCMKQSLRPALKYIKVNNPAFIHTPSSYTVKLFTSPVNRLVHYNSYKRNLFSIGLQVRCESTQSTTAQHPNSESIVGLEPIPEPPTPLSELTSVVENLTNEASFASIGLGGWTPVGIVQNSLEFLHVDCGLPWWGAVACGTLFIRLLMFPIVIMAQRNMAKLQNTLPQMQHLQMKLTEARQRGDKLDAARYTAEMMKFMKEKNINPIKNMVPPICQAPVFISVFMALRQMSNLPVESLKTGGMLWFVDLTVQDQFYLLPIVTSATLWCTIKVGADGASSNQNSILAKYILLGLPVIILPFTVGFPGLVLVYWTTSNFVSLAQVGILRIPKVRDFFNIDRLQKHNTDKLPIKDQGFVKNVKEAWNNMKITSELQERERADRMAFLKAGREPIVKTYKYDPTKVKPSSAIEAKKKS